MIHRRIPLLTTMLLLLTLSTAAISYAGASIQFENEKVDFGRVEEGSKQKIEFKFKNVGDSDLEITRIDNACGCAELNIGSKKLAPGESSKITAVFKTIGYAGKISKRIDVYTNDPQHQGIGLRVTGEVAVIANSEPTALNFGTIKPGATITRSVRLIPVDPKKFNVTKITYDGTHTKVTSFQKIDTDSGPVWDLNVQIKATEQSGRVRELVKISTRRKAEPNASFLVFGNVSE